MWIKELLRVEESPLTNDDGNKTSAVSWLQHTKLDGIRLQHFKAVSTIEWHRKGDYFTTVVPRHIQRTTNVAFHRSYPLFTSCSDDCTAYVFHGMVYSDLNQDPLIVPLEILCGHTSSNGRGVLDYKFHPRQPWLFTVGADSVIKLYCH
ncbi:uncharacterized protein A4U43_C02F18450 [Asparagus officinalis]|uniref:BOP1 N-terminal domain-containing protein n=1 Tax=Asparagus officinalis TaxID=4686 RepID=A0A5P1FLX1_ASPOF|nr:uncharacterized protein A4U43_C02F18450 [Asparagus officinalis]